MLKEKVYETAKGEIHYWVRKNDEKKQWLIFLPGLTADHHLFEMQIDTLGKKYNCLTWDAPGHGKSRPFSLTFSLEEIVQYLYNILEKEAVRRPVFVGQSLGGYLTQIYTELFNDKVRGFVSIDSAPLNKKYYSEPELFFMKHTKIMYLCIPWKLLVKWGAWGTAETVNGRKQMEKTLLQYNKSEYCELVSYGYQALVKAIKKNRTDFSDVKMLLLCGEKDKAGYTKRYNRNWAKEENLPIIWLKNAGHNANTDVPEQVNKIIDEFAEEECTSG